MTKKRKSQLAVSVCFMTAVSMALTAGIPAQAAASVKTTRVTAAGKRSKAPRVQKGKNIVSLQSGTTLYVRFRAGKTRAYHFRFSALRYTDRKVQSQTKNFVLLSANVQKLKKKRLVLVKIPNGYQKQLLCLASREACQQLKDWKSPSSHVSSSVRDYARKCLDEYHFRSVRKMTLHLKKGQTIYLAMSANGSGGKGALRYRLTIQ